MKYDTYEEYMEKLMDDYADKREIEQKIFEREREKEHERKMEQWENEKGWPVEGRHELPLGFYIRADEDFNYLYHDCELVATFGKSACPFLINVEAEKYQKEGKKCVKN